MLVDVYTNTSKNKKILRFVDPTQDDNFLASKPTCNIHIFADDHGRELAVILKKYFSYKSQITSFVKPRARLSGVMSGCNPKHYSKSDNVIIIGGTNDIRFNKGKDVLDNLEPIVISLNVTNVWLCTLPYRFDLQETCSEHNYILLVNNHIKELPRKFQHVNVIDLYKLQRYHFTANGFCMNVRGKNRFTQAILDSIRAKCQTNTDFPFSDCMNTNGVILSDSKQFPGRSDFLQRATPASSTSSSKGRLLCPCIYHLFRKVLGSTCRSSDLKGWDAHVLASNNDVLFYR